MSLDDHYRQIAQANANKTHRSFRDVQPNGETVKSRIYGAHRARAHNDGFGYAKLSNETRNRWALECACRKCEAPVGKPCVSIAKDRQGEELENVHGERAHDGFNRHRPPVKIKPILVDEI